MAIQALARAIRWLGGHDVRVLIALVLAGAGIWGFVELADAMIELDTRAFDRTILFAMRTSGDQSDPVGPRWVEEVARDVTALGGAAILVVLTVAVVAYLLLRRDTSTALLVAIAALGAQLASATLKLTFDRPRPDLVPAFTYVYTASFPSGHAMLSAAVYLTFATQLARFQPSFLVRGYLVAAALAITAAVGVSRVYLGVHWPSDVIAGWAAGAAWALLVLASARLIANRRRGREPAQA